MKDISIRETEPLEPARWSTEELEKLTRPAETGNSKALRSEDIDFTADCRNLVRRKNGKVFMLPGILLLCIASLTFWAAHAELEEVTRGLGKVIPSKSVQTIQSLEGGILAELLVREGEIVEQGQALLRIRDDIYSSSYEENLARRDVLAARIVRLEAEADSLSELDFPEGIRPDLMQSETKLFVKRRKDYETTLAALEERLALAQREEQYLASAGRAVSKVEITRAKKEGAELQGEIRSLKTRSEREAMEQFDADRAELEALNLALLRDKDRLDRTLLTSPVRGTVNTIYIDSVGRVIASGESIMEIVPLDETLLIEANVRPSDIAFIRPGHETMVKFTAYDFSIYGGLKGNVEQISVDTIKDEEGESFYQIKVRTTESTLGKDKDGNQLTIIPGMVAEVDVLTGRKSVLTYLLKPINRAKQRAFRER
ncbi:MAG: HlyD family type I secretion periplasmic adaptor subunit [Verrucomicrobiales bacterium]|nr:HlyD family type I secretion periplasmic adaptor subunit [Verrucomicrobiales bacterium]